MSILIKLFLAYVTMLGKHGVFQASMVQPDAWSTVVTFV